MTKTEIMQLVQNEIDRGGYPFPLSLIDAIIYVESRYDVGAKNTESGASGLMQVMASVVADYNKAHKTRVSMLDLRGKSPESAALQIRLGLWALAVFWRGAYSYLLKRLGVVSVEELVKIADMFYAAGPGATKKKLDQLEKPTSAAVAARWPEWAGLPHVANVWGLVDSDAKTWDLEKIEAWLSKGGKNAPAIPGFSEPLGGFVLGAIALLVGWYFLKTRDQSKG
jgi:hypothetical protein